MKKYFAYHGPQNSVNFDYKGGYGVATQSKWENVQDGDLVYVIQNVKNNNKFEFCGIFQVVSHYTNHQIASKNYYRFKLEDVTKINTPIEIDEEKCSQKLPPKESNLQWSNFKVHFCAQGATFRNELSESVAAVLDQLLPNQNIFIFAEEITENINGNFYEGAKQSITINKYERDVTARNECIKFYGSCICQVCGFDFEKTYGDLGKRYIHVHHLVPLSSI